MRSIDKTLLYLAYKKETGEEPTVEIDEGVVLPSSDYLLWLEEKVTSILI